MLRLRPTTDPDVTLLDGEGSVMTVSASGAFFLALEFTKHTDISGRIRHDAVVLSRETGEAILEILASHGSRAELLGDDTLWILREPSGNDSTAILEVRTVPDESAHRSVMIPDARETQAILPSRGGPVLLQTATTDYVPSLKTACFTLVEPNSLDILAQITPSTALGCLRLHPQRYQHISESATLRAAFHPDGNRLALQIQRGDSENLSSIVVILDELAAGGRWLPWTAESRYSGSLFQWVGARSLIDVGVDLPSKGFLFSKVTVGEEPCGSDTLRVIDVVAPHYQYQVQQGSCKIDDSFQWIAVFGKASNREEFRIAVHEIDSLKRIGQYSVRTRNDAAAIAWHRGALWVARLQADTRIELGVIELRTGQFRLRHVVDAAKTVRNIWFKPETPHMLLMGWEEKGFFQQSRSRQALIRVSLYSST